MSYIIEKAKNATFLNWHGVNSHVLWFRKEGVPQDELVRVFKNRAEAEKWLEKNEVGLCH